MQKLFEQQYGNLFLWTPVLMAFGAALYFTLPTELPVYAIAILTALTAVSIVIWHASYILRAIATFAFGFVYAAIFTVVIDTPQMPRNMYNRTIRATVQSIDYTPDKARLYIATNANEINAGQNATATVRVSIPLDQELPRPGDTINARVGLFRPATSDAPGTFDFARWAYFNHISATGYLSGWDMIQSGHVGGANNIRNRIHNYSASKLTDALVLGYKNTLTETERTIWTSAGIAHVWSISGFHMTLVSGWLFAIFYMIFRCIPYITRRIPARIPALCAAWIGLAIYMTIAGTGIATMRAFAMTTLIFAAIIFGRNAISLRNICVAFCIIFLMNPHYVMQPGFQLSFAAVFGIIWFWGCHDHKIINGKILRAIHTTVMTSVVATLFTAPFVAAHFYSFQLYGLIGNLVLLPIFSFLIMPLVLIGSITAAIGFRAPLGMAETIYDFTLRIATTIADLPMASVTMPHISNAAMMFIILGLACLIFIRPTHRRENLAAFSICAIAACITVALTPRAVFYATADHELVAFIENKNIEFNKARAANHKFAFDTWKQLNGTSVDAPNVRRKCPDGVCLFSPGRFTLAYIQRFIPLAREISNLCSDDDIDYIVSYFDVRVPKCEHKILRGGFAIYDSGYVRPVRTSRWWHNQRG